VQRYKTYRTYGVPTRHTYWRDDGGATEGQGHPHVLRNSSGSFATLAAIAGLVLGVCLTQINAHQLAKISFKKKPETEGIVVAKTLAKLTVGVAVLVTATWLGTASSRADPYGYAPWCAVIPLSGCVYWDCQYHREEECRPNITGGSRGFCALNSLAGPPQAGPYRHRRYSPY
jgi:hypothetical protein